MSDKASYSGRCLCGAIQYEVRGPMDDVHMCHCGQCRRQSGHFTAATGAARRDFTLNDPSGALVWFDSSDFAKRGFCGRCGSNLFWDDGGAAISINAGSLDSPTGLRTDCHIFVADKGDYYEIADGLPQFRRSAEEG
ncbi:MAG: GFA family protein [Alphaproteobacteria bacterium]|nr:GFA family protein [Alphaproteobacteria bacterium]